MVDDLTFTDYHVLATFRYRLRRFLAFSENLAREAGLEPQQQQVLLAIKGLPAAQAPTIRTLAERLQLQHQSVVELVDRLEERGLVFRLRDETDRRQVLISLTTEGDQVLISLVRETFCHVSQSGPELLIALREVIAHATPF